MMDREPPEHPRPRPGTEHPSAERPDNEPQGSPAGNSAVRIEVCEKHGLRYNAAADDGCARCRTESGARTVGRQDFSTRRTPSVKQGLLIAAALVATVGGGLFVAHTVAYHAGKTLVEGMMEDSFEEPAEGQDEALSDEEAQEAFERYFGDGSEDGGDDDGDEEPYR